LHKYMNPTTSTPTPTNGALAGAQQGGLMSYNTLPPIMQTPTTSGSVLTSNVARSNVNAANSYLANVNTAAANNRIATQQQEAAATPVTPTTAGKTTNDIYKTVSSIGVDLKDAKLSRKASEGMTGLQKSQALYNAQVKKITKELTNVQKNMDARTAETIAGIGREYDALVQDQEAANYQYESGVTTAGFRSGLNQYASQIQGNILHNAMSEGIKKISNIQIARAKLINEAEAARDERNYKMLTAKMEMLRQNYKDEQDSVYRLQQEIRDTAEANRKDTQFKTEAIAPQLEKVFTGDDVQDAEILDTISKNTGIAPSYIMSAYNKYKTDKEKALPASIQEYQAALRLGIVPDGTTYGQWKNIESARGSTPKSKVITLPEAVSIGAKSLAYKTTDEVIDSMTSPDGGFISTPPKWFKETMISQAGSEISQPELQTLWDAYTARPEIQTFIKTGKPGEEESLY
jgi:hypothetical protein